ncbi:MAG: hypothetical protein ABIK37_05450 [candidate division WOR-3 bacterium]
MRIQVLSAIVCLASAAYADTAWVRCYRGPIHDFGQAIGVDQTGRVCVTGKSVRASSSEDFVTIIYDSLGNQLLLDFYTGPGAWYDQATAAAFDAAGNFYAIGHSMTDSAQPRDYDILRIKYPVSGPREVAVVGCGGDTSEITNAAVADSAGNIYVAGELWIGSGVSRCMAMKLGATGGELWRSVIGGAGSENDRFEDVGLDRSGNVFFAGRCWRATEDVVMAKYAPGGGLLWMKFFDGGMDDAAEAVVVDDSGCLYAAGYSESDRVLHLLVVKLNPQGDTIWTRRYNTPDSFETRAFAMAIDSSGSVYLAGTLIGASGGSDFLTVKYDSHGNIAWTARYSGPFVNDVPYDIAVDQQHCAYVVGRTAVNSSDDDCVIVKYDSLGNEVWVSTYSGTSNGYDMFYGVAVAPSGDPCVVGHVWNESTYIDMVTAKYRSASGVLERQGNSRLEPMPASIITARGGLLLAESPRNETQAASLLTADGRRVMSLVPGPNDVSGLAPGVYFVRQAQAQAQAIRKIVITR